MPLYDGLKKELSALPDEVFRTQSDTGAGWMRILKNEVNLKNEVKR